ncbi:MAG: hypothetical protein Ct9H90mP8_0600 [Pseudomonadota bacterium]|nr:MAG: hypothetical protein Ct9H90mP8_0600 [Pseudomonadota bacterium]
MILNDQALEANPTNEGGYGGTNVSCKTSLDCGLSAIGKNLGRRGEPVITANRFHGGTAPFQSLH